MHLYKLSGEITKDYKVHIVGINYLQLRKPKYFIHINFPVHRLGIDLALYTILNK